MKVSIQSLGKRNLISPGATFAAVAASLLSLTGACANDPASNGSAPFTALAAAGTPPASAAGQPATAPSAGVAAPATAGGAAVPPAVGAAGSGTTTAAVATAGTGAAATAGTGAAVPMAGAASVPATFTAVLAILADSKNNCALCHKKATIGGGLMFDPTDKTATHAALVGPVSKGTDGSTCGGKTYVVAGKPDDSLLYDKVSKDKPICGLRMPASGITLDDPEIATIKAWIMAGAPND